MRRAKVNQIIIFIETLTSHPIIDTKCVGKTIKTKTIKSFIFIGESLNQRLGSNIRQNKTAKSNGYKIEILLVEQKAFR